MPAHAQKPAFRITPLLWTRHFVHRRHRSEMLPRRFFLGGMTLVSTVLLSSCRENGRSVVEDRFWAGITPIEVASGPARRGPWRMNESDFDYVDDPTVAISNDGHVGMAWVDQGHQETYFQMLSPDGQARFPTPIKFSASPGTFTWMPRIVMAANDPRRVYALWQEIVFSGGGHGGEIFFARSGDGGATFSAPINLSNSIGGDGKGQLTPDLWANGSLVLAIGPDGNLYAAWTEFEGRLLVSRSIDGGATFADPLQVGDANRLARGPALAVDDSGVVYLAWSAGGLPAADILIASSIDGGRTFGAPEIVTSTGHADAPKLAVDKNGTLHLVYAEGEGRQYHIRYARRSARGGSFAKPTTIAVADETIHSVSFPDLAVDRANRIYVIWELYPEPRQHARGLGFTMSRDGGQNFTEPEVVPQSDAPELGYTGSLQGSLMSRIAVNAKADVVLVSSTFAPDRSSHIWLWRRPVRP